MPVTSDAGFTWADRAAQRGVAFSFVSNCVLTALSWPAMWAYYDHRVLIPGVLLTVVGSGWFVAQTLRMRFRRRDFLLVTCLIITALVAMALAPTTSPAPAGWSWTQGWAVTAVCGAVLLLPRRVAFLIVAIITVLQLWVRLPHVPLGVAFVEAVIPVVGALIVAWAARSASEKFEQVAAALRLAGRTEELAAEASARADAQDWWNRILHDKVLGALLLASRATSPTLLTQAREVAREALETLSRIQDHAAAHDQRSGLGDADGEVGEGSTAQSPTIGGGVEGIHTGLARLVAKHGLTADLRVRGRDGSAPAPVREAVLAAADQALRNVAQHSGQSAVSIHAFRSPTRVRVDIRDEGLGFDTSQVHDRRLGLRSSIPGHMALIAGTSTVTSRIGGGTSVALSWAAADASERGASVNAAQLRAWWWISAAYAGLHLLGGWLSGGRLIHGLTSWGGLALIVAAYFVLHLATGARAKVVGQVLVLAGCALMLWQAPHSVAEGWTLWFLGACYPALLIPALRGRPWLSVWSGSMLALIIMGEFALTSSASLLDAGQLALPFVVIPAVAALYAVMLARADGRLHQAQEAQARARRQLHEVEARQRLATAQMTMLAPGTVTLLRRLVREDLMTAEHRRAARLAEAANRDHLVAGDVLDDDIIRALSNARVRGVQIHLTSAATVPSRTTKSLDEDGPWGSVPTGELTEFRRRLISLAEAAPPGAEITARWHPDNSYAMGTLTLESDDHPEDEVFETVPASGASAPSTVPV